MEKEARIKELREMVPYLVAEYNQVALGKIYNELKTLDADCYDVRRASADAGAARINAVVSEYEKLQTQINAADEQMKVGAAKRDFASCEEAKKKLKEIILRFRERYPISVRGLYFDYAIYQPEGKNLESIFSLEEIHTLMADEDGRNTLLRRAAEKISIPNQDYDMAFSVYIALEDFSAARALRYRQGMEAMEQEKFDEAVEFFRAALDHPGAKEKAEQAERTIEVRKIFLEKVGDTKTYLPRRIGETHGATLREMRAQLNKAYIDTPEISVGSLIFCFVGFLLSLAMHTDPDMDNNVIYIFFPLAMSIALHMMFDMEFGWIKSCAITFGILILPKILHDFSVDLFDTPTPAFVLLNLLCAAPLVVALVSALRRIPANRAYHRAAVLRAELKPVESKLRAELIAEYAPLVGQELAEKWVKELRSGI